MAAVNFIVIGSMKAGSTSLSDYLSKNHDIQMCTPKEPQFFSRTYDKGIEYYEALWNDSLKVCGEASTCYTRWPIYNDVASKIFDYDPAVKLIYIMRHPVDRAYSHYVHNVLTDKYEYLSLSDAMNKSEEIISTSCYMTQIKQYLKFFPREQLLLVDFDDMISAPQKVINQVEDFLQVSHSDVLSHHSNQAGSAVSRREIRKFLDFIRGLPLIKQLVNMLDKETRQKVRLKVNSFIESSFLTKRYAKLKVKKITPLSEDERKRVFQKVIPEIEELEQFWGKDLTKWKS